MSWTDELKKESKRTHKNEETVDEFNQKPSNKQMADWNKTIAKIQDMLTSLKTHPVFEYPADGRTEINKEIDSISNQIDIGLTFGPRLTTHASSIEELYNKKTDRIGEIRYR